jgi:hypothetical protein
LLGEEEQWMHAQEALVEQMGQGVIGLVYGSVNGCGMRKSAAGRNSLHSICDGSRFGTQESFSILEVLAVLFLQKVCRVRVRFLAHP